MPEHYKSELHQNAIIVFIRRDFSKLTNDLHDRGSRMDIDNTPSLPDNTNAQLEEVCGTIDILAGGLQTLNDDGKRLHNEALQLQNAIEALNKEFTSLKLSIQEQTIFLDGLKPNQEILQQDVSSLKQKIEESEFISYDGTYTWKISNFNERMGEIF